MMCALKKTFSMTVLLILGALSLGSPGCRFPTAAFIASPKSGGAPLTVTFTDISSPGSSPITSWSWSYGHSWMGDTPDITYTFKTPGTYVVELQVKTAVGSNTARETITVAESSSRVWYVKPYGYGSGTSWNDAFGSIQDAVDAAYADGGGEVWVAAGTYLDVGGEATETYSIGSDHQVTTTYTVGMKAGVRLYGGFAGTETARNDRDLRVSKTIINGSSTQICVYGDNDATLDGFELRNGHGEFGAGMCNYKASPNVAHCTFTGNSAATINGRGCGGGMLNYDSAPTVNACIFTANETSGVYGVSGGGMYNYYSAPTITNCMFIQNKAYVVTLTAARFAEGGGMSNLFSAPSVVNCAFINNTANEGGGMYNSGSSPTITNCVFTDNRVVAFHYLESRVDMYMYGCGAGMYNESSSSPSLMNCTFARNSATYGGGIYNLQSSSPTVTNCILYGNSASIAGNEINNGEEYTAASGSTPSAPVVRYSCVAGSYPGQGNISSNPLFESDCTLKSGSPCIDTGTAAGAPNDDYLGVSRPQGNGYDMGAYEYAE